jgi:hypothetical protein
LKVIRAIINKQEDGKNPKYITSEIYDDFFTTRNSLNSVLSSTGIVVKADGTIHTSKTI